MFELWVRKTQNTPSASPEGVVKFIWESFFLCGEKKTAVKTKKKKKKQSDLCGVPSFEPNASHHEASTHDES